MDLNEALDVLGQARELAVKLDEAVDYHNPVVDLREIGEEYFPAYVDRVTAVASKIDQAIDYVANLAGGSDASA